MAKILLVEDDNNLREIYEARLMAEGYEIVTARDGEEALTVAMKEKPDLVISDVMMPKISGFDMLDILRTTEETKNVKVIMMTALSQAEDKARAEKLGADRYLVKSQVTLEDVAKVAKEVLDGMQLSSDSDSNDTTTESDTPAESEETPTPAPTPTPTEQVPEPIVTSSPTPATTTPEPAEPVAPTPTPQVTAPAQSDAQQATPSPVASPETTTSTPTPTPTPTDEPAQTQTQTQAPTPTPEPIAVAPTQSPVTIPVSNDDSTQASTVPPTQAVEQTALSEEKAIAQQIEGLMAQSMASASNVPVTAPIPPQTQPTPATTTPADSPATTTNPASSTSSTPEVVPVNVEVKSEKKVISPINDLTADTKPKLDELLAKEQEAEEMAAVAANTTQQVGSTTPAPSAPEPATEVSGPETAIAPPTPDTKIDPNSIAL